MPWRHSLEFGEEVIYVPMRAAPGVVPPNCTEISAEELEALKLVYLDGLTLDEAAARVGALARAAMLESYRDMLARELEHIEERIKELKQQLGKGAEQR